MVKPIILLARPEKDELDPLKYIDHTCHNTPLETTPGKYVIKIPRFDSGTAEEWIIFVDSVQKSLHRKTSKCDNLKIICTYNFFLVRRVAFYISLE